MRRSDDMEPHNPVSAGTLGAGPHPSSPTNGGQEAGPHPSSPTNGGREAGSQYPYSAHDNRSSLLHSIHQFDGGLGRKKCVDDRRQHNSHFCLCHEEAPSVSPTPISTYQIDFLSKQEVEATSSRRFPRNHQEQSKMAAAESPLWFARHDDTHTRTPLHVLAAVNDPSSATHTRTLAPRAH
ncbi:testis-expressed protein 36 [Engraulis encrasicolus]|uniref:testis-expressed protein 36 n=1 Tax=Engraulis encrasicolus TaxID=184585 RepID=UPI002FD1BC34